MSDSQGQGGTGLIVAGYVCGALALIVFPPGLGIAGMVCGIVNLTKGRTGHGIAQIVISVTCGFLGFIFAASGLPHDIGYAIGYRLRSGAWPE